LFYVYIHFYVNALFKNVKICYYGYNDNLLLKMTLCEVETYKLEFHQTNGLY